MVPNSTACVAVVDDDPFDREVAKKSLHKAGYRNVQEYEEPIRFLQDLHRLRPDLVLLDVRMPQISGLEVLEALQLEVPIEHRFPVIVVTGELCPEIRMRALSLSATDLLHKPYVEVDLLLKVRNLLQFRMLQRQLQEANASLEQRVQDRTRDLELAYDEIVYRMSLVTEVRDPDTSDHAIRAMALAAAIAEELGIPEAEAEQIGRATGLHDIGKLGVPESILWKPGPLTEEEMQAVRLHTDIGAALLGNSAVPLLQIAAQIAKFHHERWDGSGYHGLKGLDIPQHARIAAVVDVYDALTTERPYKLAWTPFDAMSYVLEQADRQFDADVVAAFRKVCGTPRVTKFANMISDRVQRKRVDRVAKNLLENRSF